jgi:membrane protease YdiL (CAAX protease family)
MMIPTHVLFQSCIFVLFLFGSLLVFLFGSSYFSLFPTNRSKVFKISLPIAFLILAFFLVHSEYYAKYWPVSYAFFVAASANLLSTLCGPWLLRLLKLSDNSIKGLALAKLSEALVVIATIIGLFMIAGIDLGSIYIQMGNLPLGLAIGLISFSLFAIIALVQFRSFQLGLKTLVSLLPWILTFVFSNALMEELWFRGIFLNKFGPILGAVASLILTSIVFTGAHIGATYLSWPERVRFLVILFPLALAWGFTMQSTGSLFGSTLFHAGGDLLILNGFIASFHRINFKPLGV